MSSRHLISLVCSLLSLAALRVVPAQTSAPLTLHPTASKWVDSADSIDLVIDQDIDVTAAGGRVLYGAGDLRAVRLPAVGVHQVLNRLDHAAHNEAVQRGVRMMDTARVHHGIDSAFQGIDLPRTYDGQGVVVGVLDDGIFFDHPDFTRADGSTRVRFIWDQTVSSSVNPPAPYGYGEEWSWIDIDDGTCTHVEPPGAFSHGTTVAGAATGNARATGQNRGVAPGSEIVAVRLDFSSGQFLQRVADGVHYVFQKADALGRPCVINISAGTYAGSHDGRDPAARLIDALLAERDGRAVVAAAGNSNGGSPYHLGYDVTADTAFTWFRTIPGLGQAYFDLWADTADLHDVFLRISLDDTATWSSRGGTDWLRLPADVPGDLSSGAYREIFIADGGGTITGRVELLVTRAEGRDRVEVLATPNDPSNLWRLSTTGSGRIDGWARNDLLGTSDIVTSGLPPSFVLPEIVHYRLPDNEQTIVSSFQCSDRVITVGNVNNQHGYYDVDSTYRITGYTPGEIDASSSAGPTRDGRLKPDLSAVGSDIFASGNPNFIGPALASSREKVAPGAQHARNGGTSMASPLAAGVAALYLQKRPDAPFYEVVEVLERTVRRDGFTGPNENTLYGFGKLDAMRALRFDAVLGCTDTAAFNYDPLATIDDGSCAPVILGCTDSTAFNYDPAANTDDGSCIPVVFGCTDSTAANYDPSANVDDGSCADDTTGLRRTLRPLGIHPNPSSGQVTVRIDASVTALDVIDALGRRVRSMDVHPGSSTITLDLGDLTPGAYVVRARPDLRSRTLILHP